MLKKLVYLLFSVICLSILHANLPANAQSIPVKGVPFLQNFTPDQFGINGKIWGIDSSPSGLVYFASDNGLLEYDGLNWKSFSGSKGITRSVLVLNDSTIYTGSDLDFGIWERDQFQKFVYKSIYPVDIEVNDIYEEFWTIKKVDDTVFFISSNNVYVYENQNSTIIPAPSKFLGSSVVSDTLYLSDQDGGLYTIKDLLLSKIADFPNGSSVEIVGLYKTNNSLTIVSKRSGLFKLSLGLIKPINSSLSDELKKDNVFSFSQINNKHVVFGTVLKGIFIANTDETIIHHINRNKGLINSTILSLHYSNNGKLWAGLDFGLAYLDLNSDLTYFIDYRGDFGSGSTALLENDLFYLGTNQGLYVSKWNELNNDSEFNKLKLIPGAEGQVWTIKKIDNELLVGHDKGLFALKNGKIEVLSTKSGIWSIASYKNVLLAGTYKGVSVFKKNAAQRYEFFKQMELFSGACNQIIIESENVIWVNIPNYGVVRTTLNEELYPINREIYKIEVFKDKNIIISKENDQILVKTERNVFAYDSTKNSFERNEFTTDKLIGKGLQSGLYQASSLTKEIDFYPVYNGFAFITKNSSVKSDSLNLSLLIRKVEAFNNQSSISIYNGAIVPYSLNNITIDLLVPFQSRVEYFYMIGNNGIWSKISKNNSISIFNLNAGKYNLYFKAIVNEEIELLNSIVVSVKTPWFRSFYAYCCYAIIVIIILYFLMRLQFSVLAKQEKRLLQVKDQSLLEQTKKHEEVLGQIEKVRLIEEVEHVKTQLKNKTIELANKAKENEEKNRLLESIKAQFEQLQNDSDPLKIKWGELKRLLDSYISLQDNTFEIQMDELHQEFFKNLKQKFPGLSNNDLRLCAYLKIGFSSKEMADLLNIQPSSIYISRSRLRKKLSLTSEEDLFDFLNSI
jgi:AraC family chitin signaling transcriptional activator